MTLSDLGSIEEFIGAMGVIASLAIRRLYEPRHTKQSSRATWLHSAHGRSCGNDFEQIYAQHKQGLMGSSEWEAWNEHIRMQFHQPGVQWWWKLRRTSFSESFRVYLDESAPPDMRTMVEVFHE